MSTLTNTVTNILRQQGLAKLAFNLGGLEVTGQKLYAVADAIGHGRIQCLTVDAFQNQGKLAAGMTVAARYDIAKNALLFESSSYGNAPGEDRTVVHESVHAIFDLNAPGGKGKQNLAIDDEAAAILTEAFYIRLCEKKVGGFKMMADGPQEHALNLADEVLLETDNFNARPETYILKADQLLKLRAAVARDWNFVSYTDTDGSFTDNSGLKYVYDGVAKCVAGKNGCRH